MKVYTITRENFKRYGCLIDFPVTRAHPAKANLFRIVLKEPRAVGWRIAYLITRDTVIGVLERHTDTFESFEPVKGRSLLYVAHRKHPGAIRCFNLDKPVILKKGIWHGVVAKGAQSHVKIVENARVTCAYWQLGFRLDAQARIVGLQDK